MSAAKLDGEDPLLAVVPNVDGGEATAHGLPGLHELSVRDRMLIRASAASDIALRTAAASLVAGTVAHVALSPRAARREREALRFYAELGAAHDPAVSFPRPTSTPRVHRRPADRVARWLTHGPVETLRFDSPFEPVNPGMRDLWKGLERNNTANAQHWRHQDGPRPTLCVIHGFCASPYLINSVFLQLPWFYRAGFDVLLYTLPFHSARAERWSPYSGSGYFSHGMSGFAESMAQAVHDFRIFVDYLESTGVTQIGVTGISLGGYTSALLACVEDRLQVVMPNVPVVDVADLMRSWFPASAVIDLAAKLSNGDRQELAAGTAYHSPLNYEPLIAKERRLIITGLGDRLAPPEQSVKLWLHWDRCLLHWFPGSHILHVSQPYYLRRMARFMRDNDFTPDDWCTDVY